MAHEPTSLFAYLHLAVNTRVIVVFSGEIHTITGHVSSANSFGLRLTDTASVQGARLGTLFIPWFAIAYVQEAAEE